MLTLDEDILCCDEKAKICRELAILYKDETSLQKIYNKNEGEYLRFKGYLKELKRLRESERPKGEWITICTLPVIRKCSLCGVEQSGDEILYGNFCPNCGADMKKGEAENDK